MWTATPPPPLPPAGSAGCRGAAPGRYRGSSGRRRRGAGRALCQRAAAAGRPCQAQGRRGCKPAGQHGRLAGAAGRHWRCRGSRCRGAGDGGYSGPGWAGGAAQRLPGRGTGGGSRGSQPPLRCPRSAFRQPGVRAAPAGLPARGAGCKGRGSTRLCPGPRRRGAAAAGRCSGCCCCCPWRCGSAPGRTGGRGGGF